MITDIEYKELLERYGLEVDCSWGYIRNDDYIGKCGDCSELISRWYCDGEVYIYRPTIRNGKISFGFDSVLCSSPKEFENKLQQLMKKIKNMKEQIKMAKIGEMFK